MAPERKPWLDVCRAMAIGLVLLGHGRLFLREDYPWLDSLRFGGYLGVELFFVLSGFLIGGILLRTDWRRPGALKDFWGRRWFRTLPNYYLFLALNVLLGWWAIGPRAPEQTLHFLLFLQNLAWTHPPFFPESWSLAVEEWFYLLFPPLLLVVWRQSGRPVMQVLPWVAASVLAASLLARLAAAGQVTHWDGELRKVVVFRFDTLMLGVLLAWLWQQHRVWMSSRWLHGALLGLLVFCIAYFVTHTDAEMNASLFAKTLFFNATALGCAGLILVGMGSTLPVWLGRFFAWLAGISYAAYLVNIPVALSLYYFVGHYPVLSQSGWFMALSFLALTLLAATVVTYGYERQFYRWRDRWFPAR